MLNTDQIKMIDVEIEIERWNELTVGNAEHSCKARGQFVRINTSYDWKNEESGWVYYWRINFIFFTVLTDITI